MSTLQVPHNSSAPALTTVLSFLKHIIAGKVHPAAVCKIKINEARTCTKRRTRDSDSDEYLPNRGTRGYEPQKKPKQLHCHNPMADAVALSMTFRGMLQFCKPSRASICCSSKPENSANTCIKMHSSSLKPSPQLS